MKKVSQSFPQGLSKPSAQLSKDLCPIIKPFSPITTATMAGKEKVTQQFSAIQPMNPQNFHKHRCGLCMAALQSRNLSSEWETAMEFSKRKTWNTARLQETPWKRFFQSFAILNPDVGSLYPQIKMFLWVSAFKAWTSLWLPVYSHFLLTFSSSPVLLHHPKVSIASPGRPGNYTFIFFSSFRFSADFRCDKSWFQNETSTINWQQHWQSISFENITTFMTPCSKIKSQDSLAIGFIELGAIKHWCCFLLNFLI